MKLADLVCVVSTLTNVVLEVYNEKTGDHMTVLFDHPLGDLKCDVNSIDYFSYEVDHIRPVNWKDRGTLFIQLKDKGS